MTTRATPALGPTRQLAEWASQLALDHIPSTVQQRAKHLVLDGLGCALIGAQLPWSRTAVDAVLAFEGVGDHVLIGWDRTTSAPAAALLNGTFIQGFELDDFHPFAPLHSASLIVPALLAAAPFDGTLTGADVVRAAVVGFEVGPRVGLALHGAEMLTRGWHSGSVFGPIAAAVAVGNLLGLDVDQMEHAIGLGATQASGLMAAQFGAMSKRMHHGMAARNGLYSALLARGGYTGIEGVFEQPYGGYLATFGEGHNPDVTQITLELGERWEVERIVVKPYAAMGGLHAALDALFEITRASSIRPSDVEQIDVDLSEAVYHHGWWPPERPLTPTGAQMNVGYALAVALIDGEALAHQFSPTRIDQDDVWEIVPRITAHHRAEYDELGPMGRGQTEVRVTMRDGSVHASSQFAARSILEPLTNADVVDKFRHLTSCSIEVCRQDALVEEITQLDQCADLAVIHALLAPAVRSPFETGERR
jgi:2-methylcitrate dehydratase PrpD